MGLPTYDDFVALDSLALDPNTHQSDVLPGSITPTIMEAAGGSKTPLSGYEPGVLSRYTIRPVRRML